MELVSETVKVTLVTPTFQQAQHLEETIRSVLAQEVPELEYIVVDGGSTDGTIEIIRRYESRLAWWCSERDRGQVHALNKAFARATGDLRGFINSDDVLLPGALRTVLDHFATRADIDLLYGGVEWMDLQGQSLGFHHGNISTLAEVLDIYGVWWRNRQWVQPEVFYRRPLQERVGPFDERYHLAFDYDFWVRCFRAGARVASLPEPLVRFRLHPNQKSFAAARAADEIRLIVRRHLDEGPPLSWWQRARLNAELAYDSYQLGTIAEPEQSRPPFFSALLQHPEWLLAAPARSRMCAAIARIFRSKQSCGQQ